MNQPGDQQRAAGILDRLPATVLDPAITLVKQVLPKLAKVRRPRDLIHRSVNLAPVSTTEEVLKIDDAHRP